MSAGEPGDAGAPPPPPGPADQLLFSRAVEVTIRLGLVLALAAWCFAIVRPFVGPVVWGVIIAVAVHPAFQRLRSALGGRRRTAATLLTVMGLLLLIAPTALLAETLVEGVQWLAAALQEDRLEIPPPPTGVADWPIVGGSVYSFWSQTSENLQYAVQAVQPQFLAFGSWLLSKLAGVGLAVLQFIVSILIAGVLLANDSGGGRAADAIARRLAGSRGTEFAGLARATVRSVSQGILGVALIQALLAGLGFLAVGVPGAGLWALLGLLLCVMQIGLLPVVVPIVIYVFSTSDPLTATLFTVWSLAIGVIDNVLKPLLLGRGVRVPMLVIFLGAIGGFLTSGIIGLFVGSVVLVLGYTLFTAWLQETASASPPLASRAGGDG